MNKDDDMSNTFVAEVGQKSAIFKEEDDVELLDDNDQEEIKEEAKEEKEELFPEVKIDPPSGVPSTLEDEQDESNKEEPVTKEEEEFLEASKKNKSKKYKKRNPFLTFLLMIICLALGAGASYYYFEVYNSDSKDSKQVEPKNEEKITVEQISPNSRFVNKLVNKYTNSFDSLESYIELYSKDSMTVADLSNEYTQKLGVLNLSSRISFKNDDLQGSLDELFGDKKVQVEKKAIELSKCYTYKYNNEMYTLEAGNACGGTIPYYTISKIVKAEKNLEKNELYINVSVAVTDGNKLYKSYDDTSKVGKDEIVGLAYETFDIDKEYTKFNQYKYTFKYDKDNSDYYLVSIELDK